MLEERCVLLTTALLHFGFACSPIVFQLTAAESAFALRRVGLTCAEDMCFTCALALRQKAAVPSAALRRCLVKTVGAIIQSAIVHLATLFFASRRARHHHVLCIPCALTLNGPPGALLRFTTAAA